MNTWDELGQDNSWNPLSRDFVVWEGASWLGNQAWNGTTWLGNQAWNGTTWLGNQVWNGTTWLGNQAWNGITWLGNQVWNGTTWLGDQAWNGLSWLGKQADTAWDHSLKAFISILEWAKHEGVRLAVDSIKCIWDGTQCIGEVSLRVLGYAWNSPNTVIGMVWGGAGWLYAKGFREEQVLVGIDNNAIEFRNHPWMIWGDITLGNTIHYNKDAGPKVIISNSGGVTYGEHESAHTIQGEILGPIYLPAHVICILISWGTSLSLDQWVNNPLEWGPDSNPPTPWVWGRP